MPIAMEPAAKFTADIALGKVVRYGALLKDAGTGQIVGHLKETGNMASILSNLVGSPFSLVNTLNPLSFVMDGIGHGYTAYQLGEIKSLVKGLQLATNVAAISSVAGLGISVAGFAVVNKKLNKIDAKLDLVAGDVQVIRMLLSELSISWEAMSHARFQTAAETLTVAEKADTETRRQELVKEAVSEFALLRNYYSRLLQKKGLFQEVGLELECLYDIVARYTVSCMGVLQAEFMTGDLGSYRTRLNNVLEEYADLVSFSPQKVYLARCDQMEPLSLGLDHESLSRSLVAFSETSLENVARIESYRTELEYLENNNLSVSKYLEALREHDTDIVLLRR